MKHSFSHVARWSNLFKTPCTSKCAQAGKEKMLLSRSRKELRDNRENSELKCAFFYNCINPDILYDESLTWQSSS